jgi:circadian clock protein KaiC
MTARPDAISRIPTGIVNLDRILGGGLPKGSISVLAGPPGSGKTILAQQFCFHNAATTRVAYFTTLTEPTAKTLLYMSQFSFFDAAKIENEVQLVDLGLILRTEGLEQASDVLMEHVKRIKPGIVVIDSFKSFDDLTRSRSEFRKFGYQLAVNLMAWEVTGLLLGEYAPLEYETNPMFSIVDGLISVSTQELSGEWQRFIQVLKMRGISHSRDPHAYNIQADGIHVFAPRVTIRRDAQVDEENREIPRSTTGVTGLDALLGEGIPHGSSVSVAGVPGTGKTILLMDFAYRGARAGEKSLFISFEETPARLRATALGLGWDWDGEIKRGMLEVMFIPQPEILVEADMLAIQERVVASGAKRIAIDSVSLFLHKITDPSIVREKIFQLATIVQNAGAVGFFATDIVYGSDLISRLGVEETIVDGVILLTAIEEDLTRQRYVEVYKLRNTAHSTGRRRIVIGASGIEVFADDTPAAETPKPGAKRRKVKGDG